MIKIRSRDWEGNKNKMFKVNMLIYFIHSIIYNVSMQTRQYLGQVNTILLILHASEYVLVYVIN